MIIDTGAGIGGMTQAFIESSDLMVVVTMPDPSAITDAYATIKINAKSKNDIFMVVNMAKNEREANSVYERMKKIANANMPELNLKLLGFIISSSSVSNANRARCLFSQKDPMSRSTQEIKAIAKMLLINMEQNMLTSTNSSFKDFFKKMLRLL